jgi:hypothetical protein
MPDRAGYAFPRLDYLSYDLLGGRQQVGYAFPRLDYLSYGLLGGRQQVGYYEGTGGGGPSPPPIQYYRMRAWNLTTVDWEVWTSTGAPDVTPPSGDPVTGITVVGVWEE